MGVILLRAIVFLICAFLVGTSFCELLDQLALPSGPQTLSGGITSPKPKVDNESTSNNESSGNMPIFHGLLELVPDEAMESVKLVWQHGRANQLAVVSLGLLTCLAAIFLAGPLR